ncbi:MAG TPA: ferrous iron transport protein B [Bacteroidota bacterium]|nr:ferrous iron transport protein B [Bacteroidota bacterium]
MIDRQTKHQSKHKHRELAFLQQDLDRTKVVLAGNPNVGKSLLFNAMSGLYADVSNFPGTTVEINRGFYGLYEVYDTPGIYSVSSFTDEERVARDMILEADIVLNVVDGTHLERDLFLTQQLIDMGKRVTVFLNFSDEMEKKNIKVDVPKLSTFLGVEVIPISATKGVPREVLDAALKGAREGVQREGLHRLLHGMLNRVGSQAEALLVLEEDVEIANRHGVPPEVRQEELYIDRRNRVNYIINHVLSDHHAQWSFGDWLGRILLKPLPGFLTLIGVLYLLYIFVGKIIAQDLVGLTEVEIGKNLWEPWIREMIGTIVLPSSWIGELIVGEFGVVTMTTTYLIFLLLPLVAAFYFALSLLEDSGYLPRLATLLDRSLTGLGLNGRAVIPLVLGFGCVTSATITTRLLGTEREKTIATAILQFAIPCSAQLAVIASLLAGAGFVPILLYVGVMTTVFIAVGTVLHKTLPGMSAPLLLDLPPMRWPRASNVLRKTGLRTWQFMKEASSWFFVGTLAVGIANLTGALQAAITVLSPLTTVWLQLPAEAATSFIMGVVRRDFGAAGLYSLALDPLQTTVALIVITLFVPCITALIVMMKERGVRQGIAIWIGTWIVAFAVGGIVSQTVL